MSLLYCWFVFFITFKVLKVESWCKMFFPPTETLKTRAQPQLKNQKTLTRNHLNDWMEAAINKKQNSWCLLIKSASARTLIFERSNTLLYLLRDIMKEQVVKNLKIPFSFGVIEWLISLEHIYCSYWTITENNVNFKSSAFPFCIQIKVGSQH